MTKLYNMYFNMMSNLKENLNNKRGQGMVEYVLIIAFIGLVVLLVLTPLGKAIAAKFTDVQTEISKPPAL